MICLWGGSIFIKTLIKKIVNVKRLNVLKKDFIKKNKARGKKAFLFGSPTYWNLGDQAIAVAEHKCWLKNDMQCRLIDVPKELWFFEKQLIKDAIGCDDVILFTGGGYVGDVWFEEQQHVEEVLTHFKDNPFVFFPQTAFFRKNDNLYRFIALLKTRNVLFYSRDMKTFDLMRRYCQNNFVVKFAPDMVMSLSCCANNNRNHESIICIRNDAESVLDNRYISNIMDALSKSDYLINRFSTVKKKYISLADRDLRFEEVIKTFQQCEFVITDRLHGMLLSVITGTPVLYFDNLSNKVSGAYEWIKNNKYVAPYNIKNTLEENIKLLNTKCDYIYDNSNIRHYYKEIFDDIKTRVHH